jgi:hypothetical protein
VPQCVWNIACWQKTSSPTSPFCFFHAQKALGFIDDADCRYNMSAFEQPSAEARAILDELYAEDMDY